MSKGTHIILDCFDIPREVCLDDKYLLETAVKAVNAGGATVINTIRYRFGHESPAGCAVIIMLDESHITLHTYADEGMMAIDVFTCGTTDSRIIMEYLIKEIKITNCIEKQIERFEDC